MEIDQLSSARLAQDFVPKPAFIFKILECLCNIEVEFHIDR